MEFTRNEGDLDRAGRGVLALIFGVWGLSKLPKGRGFLCLALAALFGVTAATGSCPAYQVAGIDTRESCSVENASKLVDRLKGKLGL